ncbi:MAG: class I SAM-dependent methyltransferase [Candidatus Hodarchaeota archaeon]
MSCPQCQGIESTFNHESAVKELNKYHKKGPSKTTRFLINFFVTEGIKGKSLLDIGGGVGTIQHELLRNGMAKAISVEASSAYSEVSKGEAERQGHADRVQFHHGNFIDLAPDIPKADVVTLDRVICCYPDMEKLVENSLNHAREYYAVVYPLNTWWMKVGITIGNVLLRIKRSNYRGYVHSEKKLHRLVEAHNFKPLFFQKTFFWRVEIFQRIHNDLDDVTTIGI